MRRWRPTVKIATQNPQETDVVDVAGVGWAPEHPNKNDTIAVIIPVYNGSAYLAQAIQSALNQTLPADEIIVVDDGSTDETLAIAGSFPFVKVHSQENAGVARSRNRGVELSSSKWIAFLDHDDIWEPRKLEQQMKAIHDTPGVQVCLTGRRNLTQVGNTSKFVLGLPDLLPPPNQIDRLLYRWLRFVPSCVMLQRSLFERVGGFDPTLRYSEDWDMWLRIEQAGAVFVCCGEPLLQYRIHSHNTSNNSWEMYHGELATYDRCIAPRIHPLLRPIDRLSAKSRFLAGVSVLEREQNRRHLGIMLSSIAHCPFGQWGRYKVMAHMILKRVHLV
jgi:GT2 family glycosyltransferase